MRISLSIPLTLSEIASVYGGELIGDERTISHIVTDSRECEAGDLFFALRGDHRDGAQYATDAASKGASVLSSLRHCDGIYCKETNTSLLKLASYYKQRLKMLKHTVAITGSVGKSTTKEITAKLLSYKFKTHKTPNNLNNSIGLPLSILSAPCDTEALVLEMGMNHIGEISALSKAAHPDIAIITNIGTAHIGNLGSREEIARAKLEICDSNPQSIIIPYGEPLLCTAGTLTFSTEIFSSDVSVIEEASHSQMHKYRGYVRSIPTNFSLETDARYIAKCTAAALGAAICCGVEPDDIGCFSYNFSQNTWQNIKIIRGLTVIEDFYNASYESFISGFDYCRSLKNHTSRSALIGDILELGDSAIEIHRTVGSAAAEYGFSRIFAFGKFAEYVKAGAVASGISENSVFTNYDTSRPHITAEQIIEHTESGELIYAKASRGTRLERITDALEHLGRRNR